MKKPHSVLIINASWVPIHLVTWEKAVSLIYNGKVKCIDSDWVSYEREDWLELSKHTKDFYVMRSPSVSIALPEVASLKSYVKLRKEKGVKFSRQNIISRDSNRCAYCFGIFPTKELTLDHVLARSKGGGTNWANIVSCCLACNLKKADKTPEEAGMPLLIQPRKPEWSGGHNFKEMPSWARFMDNVESKPEFNIDPEDLE